LPSSLEKIMQNQDSRGPAPSAEGVRLRRAIPADAAAIRELTRAAYAKWVPVIGREPSTAAQRF